jgi:hypothetical protein
LCLGDLSNNILYSKNIRIFFDYILNQIKNFSIPDKPISNIFEENIIGLNQKIFELNFDQELEEIFEKKLEEENDLIKFLYNPNKFYLDKIKDKYNSIMDDLINNNVYIELIKFYKLDIEQDNEQVDHFKNFCDSLKTKYNDNYWNVK